MQVTAFINSVVLSIHLYLGNGYYLNPTIMRTSDSLLWRTLKFFQLHKVYRAIKGALPSKVVDIVSDVTIKNVHMPLIYVEALEPKYEMACKHLQRLGTEFGDYIEFGVSQGTSMACMHRVLTKLKLNNVRLFGFDSFEGMPESAAVEDEGTWTPGQFASTIEETKDFLNKENVGWHRTFLIKGWFENTLNTQTTERYGIRKASIIMVDCDIYSAAKASLNYSLPLIEDHAVVFFDDWRDDAKFGEFRAFSEFLNENKWLRSEEIGTYHPTGKIFSVTNTQG